MRRSTAAGLALLALALAAQAGAAPVDTPYCAPRAEPAKPALTLIGSEPLDARSTELTLRSAAMEREEKAVVTLPVGYEASRRYPVLYLLHGAFGSQRDYVENGIAAMVGDRPWIVVSVNGGRAGSYSDWYGLVRGQDGVPPAWETHHLAELVPYVDATYSTVAERGGRAIMGISMGGAGTMKYAAARPDLFGSAVSLSGAVNTTYEHPFYPAISQAVWLTTLDPASGPLAHCTWGDPVANQVVWRDNDPTYLAENLRGVELRMTSGDGNPGPLDGEGASFDVVEWTTFEMTKKLSGALTAEGIAHEADLYGAGTHTWPYWQRELRESLTWLDVRLGRDAPAPAVFDHRSARGPFTAHGWHFTPHHDTREFTYLDDVSMDGLTAAGSGTLDVVSPPIYTPGATYSVGRAGDDGRLRFTIDLGQAHPMQQTDFPAEAPEGWTRTTVEIAR
jgi:S-formylglutathione hydrolase FrmB